MDYVKLCFDQGQWEAAEATCQAVLAKNSYGYLGYEALAGRAATYILDYLQQHRSHNPAKAQDYYRRCLVFSETIQLTTGYCVFANAALGNLAAQQHDVTAACRYYAVVMAKAGKHEPQYQEARAYLRQHDSPKHLP